MAESDIQPDLIIGDSDSIPEGLFPDVPREALPTAKNFTDGEAALPICSSTVVKEDSCLCSFGGRLDHLLANVFLPLQWPDQAPRLTIFSDDCEAVYSLCHAEISGCPGDTLSIIPITPEVKGITLTNLAYDLNDYDLISGSSPLHKQCHAGKSGHCRPSPGLGADHSLYKRSECENK